MLISSELRTIDNTADNTLTDVSLAIGHGVGDIFSEPAWNRVGICTIDESE